MKLWNRFKRLGFWSRLGAIGAVCSVVALVVALAGWLLFRGNGPGVSVSMQDSPASRVQIAANSPNTTQIIADNVTIINASGVPEPKLSATVAYANKAQGGEYVTLLNVTLDSPYSVPQLYVEAHAPTIQRVDIHHARTGTNITGPWGKRQGYAFNHLQNASGKIEVKLVSTRPERFEVRYKFIK